MAFHTRSVSLPTRSHPFLVKAEEELNKLRACVGSSSSALKYEILLDALKAVGHVYYRINDLLCMSSNQNGLMQHRRTIDLELDESIKVLDLCSTSRDNLDAIKSHVQDLELACRRGDSLAVKNKIRDYILITKKATKDVKSQICRNNESADADSLAVVSLLLETREITISLLQSIFSYLSSQLVSQKTSKWSLVSRLVEKKIISFKEEKGEDSFDASTLRNNVEELENGVEILFRHLIQCRASLLNVCSL
jgi:Arabidopsis protein of unknown function